MNFLGSDYTLTGFLLIKELCIHMYFAYRNLSKIFKGFQGYLEIPWKILESLKHSTLALIYTSLEDVSLDIALKFKVFQGQLEFSLEI